MSTASLYIQSVPLFQRHAMFNTHATYDMLEGHQPKLIKEKSGQKVSSKVYDSFFSLDPLTQKKKKEAHQNHDPLLNLQKKERNLLKRNGPNSKGLTKYMQSKG